MKTYKINIDWSMDNEQNEPIIVQDCQCWSGYTEKVAIAQAFLYYAQNGARSLKVIEICEL